jgi:hypothetical protein
MLEFELNAIVLIADDVSVTGVVGVFGPRPHGNPEAQRLGGRAARVHEVRLQRCMDAPATKERA